MKPDDKRASLEKKLNYQFNRVALLEEALSHRSVTHDNNERLEFLGDSILNFMIAEVLHQRCPDAREGFLSRTRAHLVKGETLAEIAKELSIGKHIKLGHGELKTGGSTRHSILSDALEAIIAAIYLDSNLEKCREIVLHWFADRLTTEALHRDTRDAKTQLQEYLQANKYALPTYSIASVTGRAHNQLFHINCQVRGIDLITKGKGATRRNAEQMAAQLFLEKLRAQ